MAETEGGMLLILAGIAVIPFVSRRLRIPAAALEIVFGCLLFNFALHAAPAWFEVLRELGFIYLMFIAGMELDLPRLLAGGRFLRYALIPAASFLLTPLLFAALGQPFFLGLAVAMISAGIAIPVLKESGLEDTVLGETIVGVALLGELLSIVVLTLIDALHRHGPTLSAALELARLAGLFALALLVLKVLYLLAWWHPERVTRVMESEDPVEEGLRAVVTVAFAGAALAVAAGTEAILGSFLAGTVFSCVFRGKGRFEEKVNALGFGFLVPFFFVGVGARLDLTLLAAADTVLYALFLAAMVLVSNLPSLFLARLLGLGPGEGGRLALLLSAPLSMVVVAGTLGVRMGLLDPAMNGTLVLAALLASVLYPSLFRRRMKAPGGGEVGSS